MEDDGPVLSIGELARRTRLPVRTIRFWSDAGVLPSAARTGGGRRLYDAACVARLDLVVTLRELGLGLADVRRVLDGQASIAEVAAVHLEALDAQISALRLHRAVLRAVVKRAAGKEEMTLMNKLARMSAAERRQMIDDFLADVFGGLHPSPARAARWNAAPNQPDDPTPEQVDAWVEIAELVSDPGFRQVMDLGARFGRRSEPHPLRTVPRRPGHPPGHPDQAGAGRTRQADAGGGHAEPAGAGAGDGLRDLVHEAREYAAAAVLRGVPAGFRRGRPGSEPPPGACPGGGSGGPRGADRRARGGHRSADRPVPAAHGHHQRMAAVPVAYAGRPLAARRAARPRVTGSGQRPGRTGTPQGPARIEGSVRLRVA
jgi:DNA-binding transcriptional MerR regulator